MEIYKVIVFNKVYVDDTTQLRSFIVTNLMHCAQIEIMF